MAPTKYWRVQDEHSRARFHSGDGILAENLEREVDFKNYRMVRRELEAHLDWANRRPTSFISCYADRSTALREAHRRIREGKRDVWVLRIDLKDCRGKVDFRQVRRLARRSRVWIEDYAWNNSESEYIFHQRIPHYVVTPFRP